MGVEDALVSNLFQGFMICFPVIWVVLVLVTGNIILAFYATFSIACIVVCVLGAAKRYSGWSVVQHFMSTAITSPPFHDLSISNGPESSVLMT